MKWITLLLAASLMLAAPYSYAKASRDEAAATAQRLSGGRVLSVEKSERDGKPVWKVKVVTGKGEVQLIYIDIESGSPV